MSAEVTDFAHRVIQEHIEEGWTEDEILDDLDHLWDRSGNLGGGHGPIRGFFDPVPSYGPMPVRLRRSLEDEVRSARAEQVQSRTSRRIVSYEDVMDSRMALQTAGRPYGDAKVAAKLGVDETTVRRVRREGPNPER